MLELLQHGERLIMDFRIDVKLRKSQMDKWLETLRDALDLVEYGVVLLDEDLNTRFINQAFREMWAFPQTSQGEVRSFESILHHGNAQGHYNVPENGVAAYLADRIARVRAGRDGPRMLKVADGRTIKFECIPLPQGGRMLTYGDQTELVRMVDQLEAVVNIDELTQICNRRYYYQRGAQEFALTRRHDRALSVVMMDIDFFKQVNDLHGHATGDAVLHAVAQCCQSVVRTTDLVGRVGGEEFAVLLPETAHEKALQAAERLRSAITGIRVQHDTTALQVTASFGVASIGNGDDSFDVLMRRADAALYDAKHSGRNRVASAG